MPMYMGFVNNQVDAPIDLDAEVSAGVARLYVQLHTSTYTPDYVAHTTVANLTNEVSGTGYTAGGQNLGTITVSNVDTGGGATVDATMVDAADLQWTSSTITARYAILCYQAGASKATTDPLIALYDFGSDQSSSGSTFTLQFSASGVLRFKSGNA